jgi:hypothetical protein
LGFAYCDFYQRNPRAQLISGLPDEPEATPIPTLPLRQALRPSLDE